MESVNALNVFPVPDGDTGTNMFLTLQAVVEGAGPPDGAPASEVASAMARAALMGARGNSGVILSQLFKGFETGLDGAADCGAEELAAAYASARDLAYKSVAEPVEGTMLTVMSSVADAARGVLDSGGGVEEMGRAAHHAAVDAVARTPTMLRVLRDAGVVDAGGQGIAVILAAVRGFVSGKAAEAADIAPPEPIGIEGASGVVSESFLESVGGARLRLLHTAPRRGRGPGRRRATRDDGRDGGLSGRGRRRHHRQNTRSRRGPGAGDQPCRVQGRGQRRQHHQHGRAARRLLPRAPGGHGCGGDGRPWRSATGWRRSSATWA